MSGKHTVERRSDSRRKKEEKTHKGFKIFFILLILIFIVLGILIYLRNNDIQVSNNLSLNNNKEETQINKAINNAFTALKNLDEEKIEEYIDYYTLISSLDEMIIQSEEDTSELEKALFNKLSWNIENIDITDNTAKVIVETTNKDFKDIFTQWMKNILNEKSNGNKITEELALEKLQEVIGNENEFRTETKDITLTKDGENWIIFVDNNLRDSIFPGIDIIDTALTSSN